MHIYMARDPETERIAAQVRPFTPADLPRGLRGESWALRETEIPETEWRAMLAGAMTGDEVDELHHVAWEGARHPAEVEV